MAARKRGTDPVTGGAAAAAPSDPAVLTRRGLLAGAVGALTVGALAACSSAPTAPTWVAPNGAAVQQAERRRARSGATRTVALQPAPQQIDLGGRVVSTWAYGAALAPVLRYRKGDLLQATVTNHLPDATSVHWHGIRIRNDMDGVPPLTQQPIVAGSAFRYDFVLPDAGTYWFHPHVGTQLDRGLYGALIVDDPNEPAPYDAEWVIVLDDWLDGTGTTPSRVLTELRHGMSGSGSMGGMSGMSMSGMSSNTGDGMSSMAASGTPTRMGSMLMGATSAALGGDAGDVYYPTYLINGKPSTDPAQFTAKPGARVRLRIINAGGDTAFRFALAGHTLTITHTDGAPVQHATAPNVLLGMGERVDALVTLADGVFPMMAAAEGKNAVVGAVVRTGQGTLASLTAPIPELTATALLSNSLSAASEVALTARSVERTLQLRLTGGMGRYNWAINGTPFSLTDPMRSAYQVRQGQRVRLEYVNTTSMWHPMHLHGHSFQIGASGPRKDTAIVLPGRTLTVDFDADNPGRWLTHCHNIYHAEAGMMAVIGYAR